MLSIFSRKTDNWQLAFLYEKLEDRLQWVKTKLGQCGVYVDLVGWEDSLEDNIYPGNPLAIRVANFGFVSDEEKQRKELVAIYYHTLDLLLIREKVENPVLEIEDFRDKRMFLIAQKSNDEIISLLRELSENEYREEIAKIEEKMKELKVDILMPEKNDPKFTVKVLLLQELGFFNLDRIVHRKGSKEDFYKMMAVILGSSTDRASKLCRNVFRAKSSNVFPDYISNMEEVEDLLDKL